MPTSIYLTTHQPAKQARLTRSSFLAYRTSLGLSGGYKQWVGLSKTYFKGLVFKISKSEKFRKKLTSASQDSEGPSRTLIAVKTEVNSESMPPFSA